MGRFTEIFNKNAESNNRFTRSNNYRKEYLKKHKGFFGIYTCAYCGKLCSKKGMQVDHIYPVNGVSGGSFENTGGKAFITIVCALHGPKALKEGVNADWNKTSACPRCNGNKTDNKGSWVIRGYFGKVLFPIMNFGLAFGLCYGGISAITVGDKSILYTWIGITAAVKGLLYYLSRKK